MFTELPLASLVALCVLQSAIYAAAAVCSHRNDHKSLTRCYGASAVIYALFAVCHCFHA